MAIPLTEREWLRPKEAAEYLGVSLSTLYSWKRKGLVRFYRMGPRAVGLRRHELEELGDGRPSREPYVVSDRMVREVREWNERMRRKYGLLPDSTPTIRKERDHRGQ